MSGSDLETPAWRIVARGAWWGLLAGIATSLLLVTRTDGSTDVAPSVVAYLVGLGVLGGATVAAFLVFTRSIWSTISVRRPGSSRNGEE